MGEKLRVAGKAEVDEGGVGNHSRMCGDPWTRSTLNYSFPPVSGLFISFYLSSIRSSLFAAPPQINHAAGPH